MTCLLRIIAAEEPDAEGERESFEAGLLASLDVATRCHAHRVAILTVAIAQALDMDDLEIERVRLGAVLHDLGKAVVPSAILSKPGPLTEAEWTLVRKHPVYAREILLAAHAGRHVVDAAYCHHERWDGHGYPNGLRGMDIPLVARIVAVADVADALCSARAYRDAWRWDRVLDYIAEGAGTQFDPVICETYRECYERLPASSFQLPAFRIDN